MEWVCGLRVYWLFHTLTKWHNIINNNKNLHIYINVNVKGNKNNNNNNNNAGMKFRTRQ